MRRSAILVTLAAALMSGCAATPTARLAVAPSIPNAPARMAAVAVTAPSVKVVASAPTVTLKPGAAPLVAAQVAYVQAAAKNLIAVDQDLEALELLAEDASGYQLQGLWTDFKDTIKRVVQRWKLSREVKAALKKKREQSFELHEGEIDNMRKNRTAPITTVVDRGEGLKEIKSTWTSTYKGTWTMETLRVIDAEGVTQELSVRKVGQDSRGLKLDILRVRTLTGNEGAYKVVTTQKTTFKDGRREEMEWIKTVNADASEEISGFINHRDGHRTLITGTRTNTGKVNVQVSRIAPPHNPDPTTPEEDEVATGTEEATGTTETEEDDAASGTEDATGTTDTEEDEAASGTEEASGTV